METAEEKDHNAILKGYNMLLYFAGSMIMYEPVEECVTDFWSNGMLTTLPVSSTNPRFVKAASQLRSSCENLDLCLVRLRDDYNRLFNETGAFSAKPVKSSYNGVYFLNDTKEEKVSDFYNAYGWRNRSRYNIPDDHLGIELLFLTLLNDKYIAIDDSSCKKEMSREIRRFIENHILSWISEWNEKMQEYSMTLSYKGIATLIYAICEDIYALLGNQHTKADLTYEFKN